MFSISCNGTYKDAQMKVDVTLMEGKDYSLPIEGYLIYDVRFYSVQPVNANTLEFFLSCNGKIYSYVAVKDMLPVRYPAISNDYPYVEAVTVLFKEIRQVHYKETQLLFYFPPYQHNISINLKY